MLAAAEVVKDVPRLDLLSSEKTTRSIKDSDKS